MNTSNPYQKIVPFILFILALLLLFVLVRPVITILLSSVLLAYLSFPLATKISQRITYPSISIILALGIISCILLVPLAFLAFEITQQGSYFYDSFSNQITKGALFGFGCTSEESKLCLLINQAEKFSLERLSQFGFDRQLEKILPSIEEKITAFILRIPILLAEIFLTFVIAYFILKEWKLILERIVELLPMRKKTINRLITEFGNVAYTVIYAQLFVALIQGVVGTIGFYFLGVPFPIILGLVMAFFSLIPTIGTAIIWIPTSAYLLLMGYFSYDYFIWVKGIILFFYGLLIISTIDNILLSKIVRARTNINQIVTIIGVIGGAVLFGVPGIFIGPILLPLLITYFQTFKERFN